MLDGDGLYEVVVIRHTCDKKYDNVAAFLHGSGGVEIERWKHDSELIDYEVDPNEPTMHTWTSTSGEIIVLKED